MSIEQHLIEMWYNEAAWRQRRVLRNVYAQFCELIHRALAPLPGPTVELSSATWAAKEFIPNCITTDTFSNLGNGHALTFTDSRVSNLILLNVFHHLTYPGAALKEFNRVLCVNPRVVILQPATRFLGKLVYGLFHHEPLGLLNRILWFAQDGLPRGKPIPDYYAANASTVFFRLPIQGRAKLVGPYQYWNRFPILLTKHLGDSVGRIFIPHHFFPSFWFYKRILALWPNRFATHPLMVLEKKPTY
jgi:hypothetical protein